MDKKSIQYLKQIRVLYVEDNKDIQEEMEFFLANKVEKLYVAENGKEGLELYEKYKPDVIVSDIQMPIMNGIDMITKIRETDLHTPIIISTAFNDAEYLLSAIQLNVNNYLIKPINLFFLVEMLIKISKDINLKNDNNEISNILNQYKNLLSDNLIITKINPDEVITSVNELFEQTFDTTREDLIGKSYSILENIYKNGTEEEIFGEEIYSTKVSNIINENKLSFDITIYPIKNKARQIIEYVEIRHKNRDDK